MKTCTKCNKKLSFEYFRKDKSKKDWYYSSCNMCYRNKYWIKQNPKRILTICAMCGKWFYPRTQQTYNSKTQKRYCKRECYKKYSVLNANTYYWWYKKYIKDRDNNKCFLCGDVNNLDIHHVKTRWSWGTDEYNNLLCLCRGCHTTKAHWVDAKEYKNIFIKYLSRFQRPEFWDIIMENSKRDREKVKKRNNEIAKQYYYKVKNDKKYIEKRKMQIDKRNKQYIQKYWVTYNSYIKNKKMQNSDFWQEQKAKNRAKLKDIRKQQIEKYKKEHKWMTPRKVQYLYVKSLKWK